VDAVVSCAGNAAFKPFAELSDADYEIGLRSKLMGQVSLARIAKDRLSALAQSGRILAIPYQPPRNTKGVQAPHDRAHRGANCTRSILSPGS
jgi:hypothetical protein